ncbi:hypothetical protein FRC07_013898, partial [Ceratobasidium sp. 392]
MQLPHVIMLNILYWWLVLRLHRPFYRVTTNRNAPPINASRPFGDLSDMLCDRAACKITLLVEFYNRWHGLRFFPRNMVQVIFSAGALLVQQQAILSRDASAAQQTNNHNAILECISALHTIA